MDPLPRLPPLADSVTAFPAQTLVLLATMAVGAVEVPFTVTVTLAQVVFPHVPPSALT